jgi:hypothetical protein
MAVQLRVRQLRLQPWRQASGGFSTSQAEQQMIVASAVSHLAMEVGVRLVAVWMTKPNMSKANMINLRTRRDASVFAMIFLLGEGRLR